MQCFNLTILKCYSLEFAILLQAPVNISTKSVANKDIPQNSVFDNSMLNHTLPPCTTKARRFRLVCVVYKIMYSHLSAA